MASPERIFLTDQPEAPWQIHLLLNKRVSGRFERLTMQTDPFGNRVFQSPGRTEYTLAGKEPAELVVSPQGQELIVRNRGLLKDIAAGPGPFDTKIGQGNEAQVYRKLLQGAREPQAVAVKYTFPMVERGIYTFTPQTLAMRYMQRLCQEQPVPGLHYAVPLLATKDTAVAPYISDSLNLHDLEELLSNAVRYTSESYAERQLDPMSLPRVQRNQLVAIVSHDLREKRSDHQFLPRVQTAIRRAHMVFASRLQQARQRKEFGRYPISGAETGMASSTVVKIPQLLDVFDRFSRSGSVSDAAFSQQLMSACWLVEAIGGYQEQ